MEKTFRAIWKQQNVSGRVEIHNSGCVTGIDCAAGGCGCADADSFCTESGSAVITVKDAQLEKGAYATVITLRTDHPFSFFLRDVNKNSPIYIPEYEVIVTEGDDIRSYAEIENEIKAAGRKSAIEQMETEEEESFEHAASHNRDMPCNLWMGLSRDIRMFECETNSLENPYFCWDRIQPFNHHDPVIDPEIIDEPLTYHYFAGRGIGCRHDVHRYLEDRMLPILNVVDYDGPVQYHQTMFTTLEKSALAKANVHGTDFMVSETFGAWRRDRRDWEQEIIDKIYDEETNRPETTVAYLRVKATNTLDAPKYAFIRIPQPNVPHIPEQTPVKTVQEGGIGIFESGGKAFMAATVDRAPVNDIEYAVLLEAGQSVEWVFKIFHEPVEAERAKALLDADFDEKLEECKAYWHEKLSRLAKINLPEKRIQEMMYAGFIHLDLICFGNEPDGTVAPCVGVYSPIGTESTPVIQYIEAMGDNELGGRAARFFVDKQHPDGYMQNYSDYESETGLGIWNAVQHYRFTHDKEWFKSIADKLVKSCDFLDSWAERLRDEQYRHKGYGMIAGKVSDCHLFFPSFMMNATFYAGVSACAEALEEINHPEAGRIKKFADQYLLDIRDSFAESVAVSPVAPAQDGTWFPLTSEWPNSYGPTSLFADGGTTFSHATMVGTVQPGTYEMMYGVVEPNSVFGDFIMKGSAEYVTLENTGFSQPYYSVHPYGHLLRGEVGSFLKEFYNNMSSLADRETYSFWEHTFRVSPHKTHEEAWFLNRCRWLLFLEHDDAIHFLPGVPRKWLEEGNEVSFDGMATRYGKIALCAKAGAGEITAEFRLDAIDEKKPHTVTVRLPHPERKKAAGCEGGIYDEETETVTVTFPEGFSGSHVVKITWGRS